jgi:dienelactone hydrolase
MSSRPSIGGVARAPTSASSAFGIERASASYKSGGRDIRVESYLPEGDGRHPAVLVLHGAGGALHTKHQLESFAMHLASRGFGAFLIDYFDRTGTTYASDSVIFAQWPVWAETIRDAVDFVSRHDRVRPDSIGMFGYSLGAFLAVAESTGDPRVRAVVEFAGGVFPGVAEGASRFPPMLILHGQADRRVPVACARHIQDLASRFVVEPEVQVYDGEGHDLSARATADATKRALDFFEAHLFERRSQ